MTALLTRTHLDKYPSTAGNNILLGALLLRCSMAIRHLFLLQSGYASGLYLEDVSGRDPFLCRMASL